MTSIDRLTDDALLHELRRAVDALPDAPAALQRAAIDLWPATPRRGLAAGAAALVRRIVGELSFDNWVAPAHAHGMRSARAPTRHLLFSAEGRDIDLRIVPGTGAFSIAGQVLGPDEAGSVELVADGAFGTARRQAVLDALGEFHIDDVAAGTYVMTLRLSRDEIVLTSIAVGDTAT